MTKENTPVYLVVKPGDQFCWKKHEDIVYEVTEVNGFKISFKNIKTGYHGYTIMPQSIKLIEKKTELLSPIDYEAIIRDLNNTITKYEQSYRDMSVEFRVETPEPGTDTAKLMLSAKLARERAAKMEAENLKILAENNELRAKLQYIQKIVYSVEKEQ